jgi:hypothetical protein
VTDHICHLQCFRYRTSPLPAQCTTLLAQVHRDFWFTLYMLQLEMLSLETTTQALHKLRYICPWYNCKGCQGRGINRKHEEYWQSICGQRQAKGFRKRPSAKRARELLNLSRNQRRIMTGLLKGHCHLEGYLLKMGLVDSPRCDRCKQAFETASHVLCDCEALAVLRFRHLGHRFSKLGDFADISISKVLHFVQSAGLLNA